MVAIFATPDGTEIEVVQEGGPRERCEPWISMETTVRPDRQRRKPARRCGLVWHRPRTKRGFGRDYRLDRH